MPEELVAVDGTELTVVPDKLVHYREEDGGYLATGLDAAVRAHGADLRDAMTRVAMLVVQPDGLARRQVDQILSFMDSHGFVPLLAVPFELSVEMSRTLWRFQFTAIGDDSKAIGEGVYCHGTSLMFLLEDTRATVSAPGSSRLAGIKGSSDPAKRVPESLRSTLGAPNRIFGSIHCADEPLDIVRELAILFPGDAVADLQQRLADAIRTGARPDCRAEITDAYAVSPEHDIHPERALRRLLDDIATAGQERDMASEAEKLAARVRAATEPDAILDWFAFAEELTALGIDPAGWDPLLVAAGNIQYERPGAVKVIASFSS